jgi:hypothetical protein
VEKAKVFVPTLEMDSDIATFAAECIDPSLMPPPCMPTPGKDIIVDVLHAALGSELWNLNMMDFTDYGGDWYTGVEVTIPALPASMVHLVTSSDVAACEAAMQQNEKKALDSVTQGLQSLEHNMVIMPADDRAHIRVEYCAADRTKLCREFSHFASCPRGSTCRWNHAIVETFLIHLVVAPLTQWCFGDACEKDSNVAPAAIKAEGEASAEGRWIPQRPPMPPAQMAVHSPRRTTADEEFFTPKNEAPTGSPKHDAMTSLTPDSRPKNPRLVSKKKWSDIQEESDDDPFALG